MGKRRRACWGLEGELRDDIKSYYDEKDYLSVEELVDRLRSSGKKYGRLQLKPFTQRVQNILVQLERKKPKRNSEHGGDGDLSSTLSSKPPESDSDNAIYGEEKSDLFKSMLRTTYITQGGNVEEPENNDDNGKKKLDDDDMILEEHFLKHKPMFKDLGGMDAVLDVLERKVLRRLYFPDLAAHLGVKPMSGILLHGPPGCGKTTLAHALANETKLPFYPIAAPALVSGISGASEENIRDLFSKAYRTAPSIVFIDEIDIIASKRENLQREMERRIVTQLMICMDGSYRPDDAKSEGSSGHVLVIGATNRPNAIDPALRRPGRFDREIALPIPDEKTRLQILSVLTHHLPVDQGAIDLMKIARSTPGFVGADLADLTKQASNLAMERITDERKVELSREFISAADSKTWWSPEEMEKLTITMSDFELANNGHDDMKEAAKLVQASTIREGFSTIPDVKWEDVGGLDSLRQQFNRYIVRRIKYPEYYMGLGMGSETGFLLYGPPGCGKTLIAKAVAHEAGANFIYIQGPEILNKYVGESELAIRTLFNRARTSSPCILFFDEVDALTTKRGKEGGWVVERLLNQLLVELDGADQRNGVYVIGATNRPEVLDQAILRPGRLGRLIYVPLPSPDERGLILKALAREKPIDTSVDLMKLGRDDACKNLSGADLSLLMSEASEEALQDWTALDTSCGDTSLTIKESHFKRALEKISPSVSGKQIEYYQRLSKSLKAA